MIWYHTTNLERTKAAIIDPRKYLCCNGSTQFDPKKGPCSHHIDYRNMVQFHCVHMYHLSNGFSIGGARFLLQRYLNRPISRFGSQYAMHGGQFWNMLNHASSGWKWTLGLRVKNVKVRLTQAIDPIGLYPRRILEKEADPRSQIIVTEPRLGHFLQDSTLHHYHPNSMIKIIITYHHDHGYEFDMTTNWIAHSEPLITYQVHRIQVDSSTAFFTCF